MAKSCWKGMNKNSGGSAVYGLGFLGALFYFIQQASGLQEQIFAFFKAIFWPAILVYQLLQYLRV